MRPSGFLRPEHDPARWLSGTARLEPLVGRGVLGGRSLQTLCESLERAATACSAVDRSAENWGVVHGDLHAGNCVFANGEPRPIDFGRCGFGYYIYDLAESLLGFEAPLRSALLEGYGDPQPDPEALEAFFLGAAIENFAFLAPDPAEHAYLTRAVPWLVDGYVRDYLSGRRFLFT